MIVKKSYFLFLLIFATIFTIGCKGGDVTEELEEIDSLLIHDKVDSALHQLTNIPLKTIHNQADSAYYFLLLTEAEYRTSGPNPSDSTSINYCVEYYKNGSDDEKMARSYYYKGVNTYSSLEPQKAILFLKQAEIEAEKTQNILLKHKIYEKIAYYNGLSYEKELSLRYAQKALRMAKILNDKEREAIALIYMSSSYSF